jgi:hypothetical protein
MKLPMPSGWFRIATSKEVPRGEVLTLKGHVQDVAENSVDFGHFGAVHKYTDLRDPVLELDGPRMHSKFGFSRGHPFLPATKVDVVFDTDVHGLGLSVTDLRVPMEGPAFGAGNEIRTHDFNLGNVRLAHDTIRETQQDQPHSVPWRCVPSRGVPWCPVESGRLSGSFRPIEKLSFAQVHADP